MRFSLVALFVALLFTFGCENANVHPTEQSLAIVPGGGWPLCSNVNRDQLNANTMSSSASTCLSCDLISPCFQNNGTTYSWYTPQMCQTCSSNCPITTSVGAFCTLAFGGSCSDQGTYYACGAGYQVPKGVYAAYATYPAIYGTSTVPVLGFPSIQNGGCTAWGQSIGQSSLPVCTNAVLPTR